MVSSSFSNSVLLLSDLIKSTSIPLLKPWCCPKAVIVAPSLRLLGLLIVIAFAKSILCVTCAAVDEFLACDGVPSTLQSIVNTPAPVYDTVGDLSL